ncbi:TonB-dependent receptor [Rubrivivax gelatinosus]|uniref:TonB-dependent siderophore receptor n=1 Tax=Rubrivivax gelatinosus TaxID=28068 RepID=UPI0019032790|nr:TonB-dependent siderophore receptor [Rubrivivax gelatinosus]MBK1613263.1 TonB-dependent receptor [Rubrivivax gelatinosus]
MDRPHHLRAAAAAPFSLALLALAARSVCAQEAEPRPSSSVLPEIVVSAPAASGYKAERIELGKQALTPRETPQSVSVLTRQQMDDQDMATMTEAMQQLTGVSVIANDTMNNQYYVRGYTPGVMYDGVSSYNGFTPSHQFDLAIYERIELLRGPAGLLRGVGEPGGVVNLVKKRALAEPAFGADLSVGSWNALRATGDATGALNAAKTLRGRVVVSRENRDYFYDHTHGDKWLAMGVLEWDLAPGTTLSISQTGQDHDVRAPWSGLPASSVADASGHYPLLDVSPGTFNAPDWGRMSYHTDETAGWIEQRLAGGWKLKLALNQRQQRQYYKYAYTYSGVDLVAGTLDYASFRGDYHYTREGADLSASGPFELFGRNHEALLGLNAERYLSSGVSGRGPTWTGVVFGDLDALAEPDIAYTSGSESLTHQRGLLAQLRWSLADALTLVTGVRVSDFAQRSRSIAPSALSAWKDGAEANGEPSYNLGLVYELDTRWSLYGSVADIFVPQTQAKLDGGTLDPRVGRQREVGAKADLFDGRLAASLAYFDIRDTGRAYADPDSPADSSYYLNAGKVQSKGLEAELSGRPLPRLDLSAGYTHVTTRYLKDRVNTGLVYAIATPKHQLKLWGNYRFAPDTALQGWQLGLGLQAQSAVQSSRGWRDEVVNGGWAVVNARVGYEISPRWQASLLVGNVFDRQYYASVGTPNIYNFYGEPRSLQLSLKARY